MPGRGLSGLGDLVRDLWRELNPPVRICLLAGLALGLSLGLAYVFQLPPDYGRLAGGNRIQYRTILLPRVAIVFVAAFLGSVFGTATGVVADLFFRRREGTDERKRGRPRRRPSRKK
jgi:hypothetical protein